MEIALFLPMSMNVSCFYNSRTRFYIKLIIIKIYVWYTMAVLLRHNQYEQIEMARSHSLVEYIVAVFIRKNIILVAFDR